MDEETGFPAARTWDHPPVSLRLQGNWFHLQAIPDLFSKELGEPKPEERVMSATGG